MNKKRKMYFWSRDYLTEEEYQAFRKKSAEALRKKWKFWLKVYMWMLIIGGGLAVMMFLSEDFREWMNTVLN